MNSLKMDADRLLGFADVFAFLGNSLLNPMSRTESVGLDPQFWAAFPTFDSDEISECLSDCVKFANDAQAAIADGKDMVERVSVEYTKLFIGPPSPAAPPWETMNRKESVNVGFGQPTIDMQNILADMGLQVSNENNQYADHMGLELLTLSEMCKRAAVNEMPLDEICEFVKSHPNSWIDSLRSKVEDAFPGGYFAMLLALAAALMNAFLVDDCESA